MKLIKSKNKLFFAIGIALLGTLTSCEEDRFDDIDSSFGQGLVVPVANFTYEIAGQDVTFTNTSTNATDYEWDFGAVNSNAIDTVFTFNQTPNPATVVLSARNAQSNVTNQLAVEIEFLEPSFEITSLDQRSISFGDTSIAAESYSWDFGDNLGTSTEQNPSYEYTDFGTYTVSLTATDRFGNVETFVNDEVVIAQPGAGTFKAELLAGDFDRAIWSNIQNPWAVNPDNSSDYDFWDNIALESVVQALDGGSDKGSSSGTSNFTDDSLKFDRDSKRAYQPIKIESDVDYTITAYVKNKSASAGDLVGTFYVLPYEPENETVILSDNLVSHDVFASATGGWDLGEFEFTTTSTFSFDQESVDLQEDDILTSVEEEWVVLYFVPNLTTADEVNLDDVSIITKGFE